MSDAARAAASPASASLGRRLVDDDVLPAWLRPLVAAVDGISASDLFAQPVWPPSGPVRRSAVLILFGDGDAGPDLLLTARAATLRAHAGQPAFPGGASDDGEDAVATALREGREETGLRPESVLPAALLPDLFLGVSDFLVTPVLAWWTRPGPVRAVDPAETAAVARIPLAVLADPAVRGRVRHHSGFIGPAFDVAGLIVWGFTGGILDALLRLGGWERPWDPGRRLQLPDSGQRLPDPEAGHFGDNHDATVVRSQS